MFIRTMKKTFLVTFGRGTQAISSMLRHGLNEEDRIIIILPKYYDEKDRRALNDLKAFVSNYAKKVKVSEVHIDLEDIAESVCMLKSYIEEEKGRKCIINLGRNAGDIAIITYIATIFANHPDIVIELEMEDENKVIEIPRIREEDLNEYEDLSPLAKEILKELLAGPLEVSALRERLNVAASSLYVVQMKLIKMGYVERERRGKSSILRLTARGRILTKLFTKR